MVELLTDGQVRDLGRVVAPLLLLALLLLSVVWGLVGLLPRMCGRCCRSSYGGHCRFCGAAL
jgi:hypothetical protein